MPFDDPSLPPLPAAQRLTSTPAYPKDLVASMHAILTLRGKAKMPLRIVLDAQDLELLREHHLQQLPNDMLEYTALHWAMLRHLHAHAEQRNWLSKQIGKP